MASIPEFPVYARVDMSVKSQIGEHTDRYPPYSDFNFVSILSWDTTDSAQVSTLNGNLVLRLPDYTDGVELFSFLGNTEVDATVAALLDAAEQQTSRRELRLVPEIGVLALESSGLFKVTEDPSSHDYVLSLSAIAEKYGSQFRNMRREIKTFKANYGNMTVFRELNVADPLIQAKIIGVFLAREALKSDNDSESELTALTRLFAHADRLELASYGLEIKNELKAFIVCEKLKDAWCVGHFWKADTASKGIYRYLMHAVAEKLVAEGYDHMNIEQDLGIAGLKRMKQTFCPVGRLKKYTITD